MTKQQHIIDIIWYLSFSFWFASLSVVIFGLHVVFCIWLLWLGIVFPMFTYAACSRQTLVLPLFGWMIFLNSLFFFFNEYYYFASVFRGWKTPTWGHFLIICITKYKNWAIFDFTWYLSYLHQFMRELSSSVHPILLIHLLMILMYQA